MDLLTGLYFALVDQNLSHMEKSCLQRKISDLNISRPEEAKWE